MSRKITGGVLGAGLCLAVVLTACSLAAADVIYMKTGGELEGKIIEETDEFVRLKTSIGTMEIKHKKIERIEKKHIPDEQVLTAKELYEKKTSELSEADITGRLELANECLRKGLRAEALAELRKLSELRPSIRRVLGLCMTQIRSPQVTQKPKKKPKQEQKKAVETLSPAETSKRLKDFPNKITRAYLTGYGRFSFSDNYSCDRGTLKYLRSHGSSRYRRGIFFYLQAIEQGEKLIKLKRQKEDLERKNISTYYSPYGSKKTKKSKPKGTKSLEKEISSCRAKVENLIEEGRKEHESADLKLRPEDFFSTDSKAD